MKEDQKNLKLYDRVASYTSNRSVSKYLDYFDPVVFADERTDSLVDQEY